MEVILLLINIYITLNLLNRQLLWKILVSENPDYLSAYKDLLFLFLLFYFVLAHVSKKRIN